MAPTTPHWTTGRGFVLLMLFFVLGPLGLPLLWRSPRFGRGAKVILTVTVIVYTGYLLMATASISQKILEKNLLAF